MALLLFAELVAGDLAQARTPPDDELLEFLGTWAPEELVWLEAMLSDDESEAESSTHGGAADE